MTKMSDAKLGQKHDTINLDQTSTGIQGLIEYFILHFNTSKIVQMHTINVLINKKNTMVIINGSNYREREDLQGNLDHKGPLDNLDQQDNVVNVVSKDLLDHKASLDLKDQVGREVSQETKDHRYKKLSLKDLK